MESWDYHEVSDRMVSDKGTVYSNGKFTKGFTCGTHYLGITGGDGATHYVHRMVLETFKPNQHTWLYDRADHIDRNKHNNKLENLRWSNATLNGLNTDAKNYYRRPNGRYQARITLYGVEIVLGTFDTVEEAEEVIKRAKAEAQEIIEY